MSIQLVRLSAPYHHREGTQSDPQLHLLELLWQEEINVAIGAQVLKDFCPRFINQVKSRGHD